MSLRALGSWRMHVYPNIQEECLSSVPSKNFKADSGNLNALLERAHRRANGYRSLLEIYFPTNLCGIKLPDEA